MAEQIKELIEKIQQEGIKTAENKAKEIEDKAGLEADAIIKKAKKDADKIITDAKDQAVKTEASTKVTLKQAGRDLMLGLRKEINAMLDRLVLDSVHQALDPEAMSEIIGSLIKEHKGKNIEEIIISVKKSDLEKLEKSLFAALDKEAKKKIVLRPDEDIIGGFIISYDSGKSHFDFTEKALAEYISLYLKPKLKEILQ